MHERMGGNANASRDVWPTMFAREYLFIVSRWARDQVRNGAQTSADRRHLRQLIEAAEALHLELPAVSEMPANVVRLRDRISSTPADLEDARTRKFKSFLDS